MQSSIDPPKILLTVQSIGKMLAGIAVLVAVSKGVDPQSRGEYLGRFRQPGRDLAANAYTTFQAAEMVYGLIQKGLVILSR
jgi:hypothetical protein